MSTEIRFGHILPLHTAEAIRQAMLAERHGFDSVWLPDHFTVWYKNFEVPELWTTLATVGAKTSRVLLGVSVTDAIRRPPVTTAQAAATLDQLSKGRVILGVGAGEAMNLQPFGFHVDKAVSQLIEAVETIRLLWSATSENPANYDGEHFHLNTAFLQIKPIQKLPIYFGAGGPRMRRLTGELADGWIPYFLPPQVFATYLKDVVSGARKADRNFRDIDIVAAFPTAVSKDRHAARRAVNRKARDALVLQPDALNQLSYKAEVREDLRLHDIISSQENLQALHKAGDSIPQRIVDQNAVFGTTDDCIEKIEKYVRAGARHIMIMNLGPDIVKTLQAYQREIIPYFRS